jgi:peptidoglycan/LPS O-acetylase OafA/YrhL
VTGPDKGTALQVRPTIDTAFDPRRNSLNFLRLALALAVIFSHSITIGGFGSEVIVHKTTLGTMAVYGFFGISGFLIARSAARRHVDRYLWQRFLRIFPAFWVCLFVTAFGFGLADWYHLNPVAAHRCGVSCYVSEPGGPWGYIVHNVWLRINQPDIAHTLRSSVFLSGSNGSLWSLFYEFLCYLMLAVFSLVGLLRRRGVVAAIAVGAWISEVVVTSVPHFNAAVNATNNWDLMNMLTLVPVFLAGSLLYL